MKRTKQQLKDIKKLQELIHYAPHKVKEFIEKKRVKNENR